MSITFDVTCTLKKMRHCNGIWLHGFDASFCFHNCLVQFCVEVFIIVVLLFKMLSPCSSVSVVNFEQVVAGWGDWMDFMISEAFFKGCFAGARVIFLFI